MAITVTSASAAGNVTCPTTSAGDVIVFINMRGFNHNEAYPSGFTGYPGAYQYYAGVEFTQAVSYKIADGTEGGTAGLLRSPTTSSAAGFCSTALRARGAVLRATLAAGWATGVGAFLATQRYSGACAAAHRVESKASRPTAA